MTIFWASISFVMICKNNAILVITLFLQNPNKNWRYWSSKHQILGNFDKILDLEIWMTKSESIEDTCTCIRCIRSTKRQSNLYFFLL